MMAVMIKNTPQSPLSQSTNAPDDDEDPRVKNQYKFILRAADKLRDEIAYFYDPTSISGLVSSL